MLANQRCVIATISCQARKCNRIRLVLERGGVDITTVVGSWHLGGGSYTSLYNEPFTERAYEGTPIAHLILSTHRNACMYHYR